MLAEAEEAERAAVEMLTTQGNHRVGAGARAYLASQKKACAEAGIA